MDGVRSSMNDLLEIPAFLDRRSETSVKYRQTPKFKLKLPKPPKPTGRFKKAELMQLQLWDEAPRIGSGLRLVYVWVGRKWVYLREHGFNINIVRIRKAKFNLILAHTKQREASE